MVPAHAPCVTTSCYACVVGIIGCMQPAHFVIVHEIVINTRLVRGILEEVESTIYASTEFNSNDLQIFVII